MAILQHYGLSCALVYGLNSEVRISSSSCMVLSSSKESNLVRLQGAGVQKLPVIESKYKDGLNRLDIASIASLLRSCGNAKNLSRGRLIHEDIVINGLQGNRFLENHLIEMYGKCGALQEARAVFDNMNRANSFSWNIMITAYTRQKKLHEALQIFQQMPERNVVSWNAMISAYVEQGQFIQAHLFFKEMPHPDVVSWTAILEVYAKLGQFEEAKKHFDAMPNRNVVSWTIMLWIYIQQDYLKALEFFQEMPERDMFSWNIMMSAYAQHGCLEHAFYFFRKMPQRDVVSWNAMISAYAQEGQLNEALQLFRHMSEHSLPSWNVIISAYSQHGHGIEALQFYKEMHLFGMMPNGLTFSSVMVACSHEGLIDDGCHCFVSMSVDYFILPVLQQFSSMVDLLSRAGFLGIAESLINNMPLEPDVVSWTALLRSHKLFCQIQA